jgi:hypothetical protein
MQHIDDPHQVARPATSPYGLTQFGRHIARFSDARVEGLEDRTEIVTVRVATATPLHSFLTSLAAEQFPGYIGRAPTQDLAEEIVWDHPAAHIVAIGSGRFIRAWAVIEA